MTTYVGHLMSSPVYTIERDESATTAAQRCMKEGISSLVVVDKDGQFHGLVTTRDLLRLLADDRTPSNVRIDEYVTTDVVTAFKDDELSDAAEKMAENDIHHLPVLSHHGDVRGILSTSDVVDFFRKRR